MSGKGNKKQKSPMQTLHRALKDARNGEMPPFSPESLVSTLGLEGDRPDERTLIDRFVGEEAALGDIFGNLRAFIGIRKPLRELMAAANERTANPAQEEIAHALGAVVTRQVEREGSVCGLVSSLALSSTRTDIIPPEVKIAIFVNEMMGD